MTKTICYSHIVALVLLLLSACEDNSSKSAQLQVARKAEVERQTKTFESKQDELRKAKSHFYAKSFSSANLRCTNYRPSITILLSNNTDVDIEAILVHVAFIDLLGNRIGSEELKILEPVRSGATLEREFTLEIGNICKYKSTELKVQFYPPSTIERNSNGSELTSNTIIKFADGMETYSHEFGVGSGLIIADYGPVMERMNEQINRLHMQ